MSNYANQELIRELRQRFPIFDLLSGRFGDGLPEERIPWFFALLLAAATKDQRGACCFVLDKTQGTTALTAILLALERFREDFPRLAERYARTALSKGHLVRVKPSNFVYEYDGLWDKYPDKFRLKVRDKPEWRSFPVSDVLRLEPTTRRRPMGSLTSRLGIFDHSSLDELLGITTYGNHSMIRNIVILHMAQARFEGVTNIVSLTPSSSNLPEPLASFLPWGSIGPKGAIKASDAYQVIGEPLIAVSRVLQDIADVAISAPEVSKIVLVDGARSIASDLQAFDNIADRHRVIVLASPDETDEVQLLRDRECPIWHLSPNEIMVGEDRAEERDRDSLAGRTVRMASTRERSQIIAVDCQNDDLQAAAEAMGRLAAEADAIDEKPETDALFARVNRILLDVSESCFAVGEELRSDLRRAREDLSRDRTWMTPGIVSEFRSALDRLDHAVHSELGRTEKADVLLSTLLESDGRLAIATRSTRTADSVREGLRAVGAEFPVVPIQAIRSENEWDRVILAAWPGRRRFARLLNLAVTQHVSVLTYAFERKWLLGHQNRQHDLMMASRMPTRDRAGILGIDAGLLPPADPVGAPPPAYSTSPDLPTLDFEPPFSRRRFSSPSSAVDSDDTRRARLVRFYGGCYSLLTEWSQLHVLNGLLDGSRRDGRRLPTVTASDLSIDDFVLFRAGGGKEFIRLLAEDDLGIDEYERVRVIAERWKSSLRRLGSSSAEIQRRLEAHGLRRTLPTVAGWMGNPDLIGPGDDGDTEVIGRAANDTALLDSLTSVQVAISRIRGAHIAAGSRLTQLLLEEVRGRLNQLDDRPVLLDLGYGQAWVVQVEGVHAEQQECSAEHTNRLLWTDDTML